MRTGLDRQFSGFGMGEKLGGFLSSGEISEYGYKVKRGGWEFCEGDFVAWCLRYPLFPGQIWF
jgi:hypothetical protein